MEQQVERTSVTESGSRGRLQSRLLFGFAWWAALAAIWLLFVDSFATTELIVGVVGAAGAASVAEAVREQGYMRFRPRLVWLRYVPGLVLQVLKDCAVLGAALWRELLGRRELHGRLVRVAFDYGDEGGEAAARRTLINIGISLTPNSYVVDIDPVTSTILVHQLVPGPLDALLGADDAAPPTAQSGDRDPDPA